MHEAARRHLVAELVEAGRRSAKTTNCPRCDAAVIRGEDADNVSIVVRVDNEPIDAVDEMLAILDGRATFDLLPMRNKGGGSSALWHRDRWNYLSGRDYGGTVHALHLCEGKR